MATSVLTAATDHHQATTNPSSLQSSLPQDHHDHHTVRRGSGRRKTKGGGDSASSGQKIKKQPQRGMGVEKLERIRLSKRWEKMTEINAAAIHGGFGINANAAAFSDPAFFGGAAASVLPVHLSKIAGYGAPIAGQMGFNPNQNQGYLGFHGQTGFLVPNYKELSSSPSPNAVLNCYSDHCNSCHKKKKVLNNEISLSSGRVMTRSEMYMQSCNVGDYGFLGLNIGDNNSQNVTNQETQCQKGTKAPPFAPHLSYAVGNSKQQGTVDVVAVHRRGSSTNSDGVMMEYEFFPSEKSFCRSDDDELVMKMVGRGGSEITTTTNSSSSSYYSSSTMAGFDAFNQVDLSLKLSY